jgi:hypothetical protein
MACKLGLTVRKPPGDSPRLLLTRFHWRNASHGFTPSNVARDARRFPMFAFGGAGQMHRFAALRKCAGLPHVDCAFGCGVMSTVGFLSAPMAFDFSDGLSMILDRPQWDKIQRAFAGDAIRRGSLVDCFQAFPLSKFNTSAPRICAMLGRGREISVRSHAYPLPSRFNDCASRV